MNATRKALAAKIAGVIVPGMAGVTYGLLWAPQATYIQAAITGFIVGGVMFAFLVCLKLRKQS
jgi:hypothetical protein